MLSSELAASAGVETTGVVGVSAAATDSVPVMVAALTTGLVTEVLMDGPRTRVDGRSTSPVVAVAVVVAGATG